MNGDTCMTWILGNVAMIRLDLICKLFKFVLSCHSIEPHEADLTSTQLLREAPFPKRNENLHD